MADQPPLVSGVSEARPAPRRLAEPREPRIERVALTAYPKLLYAWPMIVAGFAFWPLANPPQAEVSGAAGLPPGGAQVAATHPAESQPATTVAGVPASPMLERLGWAYLAIMLLVVLTIGIDIGRNQALVLLLLIAFVWVLGILLRDKYGVTLFGDIHRWLKAQDVQYNRGLGLCLSILLAVPYVLALGWARFNNRWRLTPNEFEHYSFGRMSESLGRGAKSVRLEFPDFFESLLGCGAGTLIVFDPNGTRELRRISNVPLLIFVRRKLYRLLERTAVTEASIVDETGDGVQ